MKLPSIPSFKLPSLFAEPVKPSAFARAKSRVNETAQQLSAKIPSFSLPTISAKPVKASVFSRVKQNAQQLSTKEKVAAVVAAVLLVGAAAVASVTAASLIATPIGAGIAAAVAGVVALIAIGYLFLKTPVPTQNLGQKLVQNGKQALNAGVTYVRQNPVKAAFGLAALVGTAHVGNTFRKELNEYNTAYGWHPLSTRLTESAKNTGHKLVDQTAGATAGVIDTVQVKAERVSNAASSAARSIQHASWKARYATASATKSTSTAIKNAYSSVAGSVNSLVSNVTGSVNSFISDVAGRVEARKEARIQDRAFHVQNN